MKISVKCPTCGTTGQLDIPDDKWENIEGDVIVGQVTPGRVCEHEFSVEIHRSGKIMKYYEPKPATEPSLRPVRFTVRSASRNIGEDIIAALLTAAISEERVLLVGAPAVTMGLKEFLLRFLPESVELDALLKTVTRDEYAQLSKETRSWMTVRLKDRKIINSAFTEDQTEWIRRVFMRAKILSRQTEHAAEDLIHQEVMKLRTTVMMLRHLAARGKASRNSDSSIKPENAEAPTD